MMRKGSHGYSRERGPRLPELWLQLCWWLFAFLGGEVRSIPLGPQQGPFRPADFRALPFPLAQKQR